MPRFGSAFLGFLALCAGMLLIGTPAQMQLRVAGLWVTEALAIALPALIILLFFGTRLTSFLGLRRPSWKALGVAVVVSGLNQPVVSFLTWAAHELLPAGIVADFDLKQKAIETMFAGSMGPMLVAVIVAAPLGEELFFRGFAFPAFSRSVGAFFGALIAGACFAFIHMDPVGFIGLMEIGIVCAALRHWSGSLWAAILAHAVNNAIAGGAFVLGYEDPTVPPPAWVLVLGGVLLVVYAVAIFRVLRRPSPVPMEEAKPRFSFARAAPFLLVWAIAIVVGVRQLAHSGLLFRGQ